MQIDDLTAIVFTPRNVNFLIGPPYIFKLECSLDNIQQSNFYLAVMITKTTTNCGHKIIRLERTHTTSCRYLWQKCWIQRSQPLRFERNDYDILLPLRLLRYMSRSLRQRRIPNSPKNACCKRLKQAVAANRVISENKTCTLLNILPPLVIHISSFRNSPD